MKEIKITEIQGFIDSCICDRALNKSELARRAGVSRQNLGAAIGSSKNPNLATLEVLLENLGYRLLIEKM